ncbi:hypothetical protein [Nocardioides sp.]|uniref:hypothetical protein n=1 Tax=Nocardioides sp. TaxID=35761 RepID=UPI0027254559|nr:hypothetical protein [Nocardioides sp.]MDO9458477.1 hypothetical protein [Nocardioides sp.]
MSGDTDYTVTGGAHGIAADFDDMDATGSHIRQAGWDAGETALATHSFLVDPNLLSSGLLSPGTLATFEKNLVTTLDGGDGLSANAVRMTGTGTFMQARAKAYAATDASLEHVEDIRQYAQGVAFLGGTVTGVTIPVTAATLYAQGFFDDPQKWMVEHPDLLEEIVASAPGALDMLLPGYGYPFDTADAAGLLAALYDQEAGPLTASDPQVTELSADLGAAFVKLDAYAETVDGFGVEMVGEPPHQSYNIYLPGTKVFDGPLPAGPLSPDALEESDTVQNLGTNFAGVNGASNAYEQSVLAALAELGVPPGAPINLMGHSQGGIIAARLAQKMTDPASGYPQYNVTSVVTAGSPVDGIDLPDDVHMLSLVNEYDVVPRLDGEHYDDHSNHTTIVTEVQEDSVEANHSMTNVYVPMAQDIAAMSGTPDADPAVVDALSQLDGFFGPGASLTYDFVMSRP